MTTSQNQSLRTFDSEATLPRIPLPSLEDTCTRFLEWCAPLLSADELAATEATVTSFLEPGGPGQTLHAELVAYDRRDGVAMPSSSWPMSMRPRTTATALASMPSFHIFPSASR